MDVGRFDYSLPSELIAQRPAAERDLSRLMVLNRAAGSLEHRSFRDLPEYLRPPDVVVLNDTRVVPARIVGRRSSGGVVQALVLSTGAGGLCRLLIRPARRLSPGEVLTFEDGAVRLRLLNRDEEGHWLAVNAETGPSGRPEDIAETLREVGRAPLPPYIRRPPEGDPFRDLDRQRYQTVFARHEGAVAAPTAGLHFTSHLLGEIRRAGVGVAYLTLHVGLGTFEPIRADRVEGHRMHAEWFDFPAATAAMCAAAGRNDGRVVAVGTTAARTLETVWRRHGRWQGDRGQTDLYIYPPFTFHAVDALLTNFHLPKSSLLLLVCAFAGRERVLRAYEDAVRQRYRFYSYGDAMLIL